MSSRTTLGCARRDGRKLQRRLEFTPNLDARPMQEVQVKGLLTEEENELMGSIGFEREG